MGAVEILICWENLDIQRYVLKNHANSTSTTVLHLTPEQEKDKSHFTDKEVSIKLLGCVQYCIMCISIWLNACRVVWKWSLLSHSHSLNGWQIITRASVLRWKLSRISHKKEVNLFEDLAGLEVSWFFSILFIFLKLILTQKFGIKKFNLFLYSCGSSSMDFL